MRDALYVICDLLFCIVYSIMSINFSTCWYNFKAKFDISIYQRWMHNMLSNVNNYNLVIYTDEAGYNIVQPYINSKIKVVVKPCEDFYTYQFKEEWIRRLFKKSIGRKTIDENCSNWYGVCRFSNWYLFC